MQDLKKYTDEIDKERTRKFLATNKVMPMSVNEIKVLRLQETITKNDAGATIHGVNLKPA